MNHRWRTPFITIWSGQAVSLLGSSLVQFALIWYLTETTGSATVLAMAALAGMLPQIVLSPFIGSLVDRWNRRWVMVVADGSIALATLVLVILFALNVVSIWHIYVLLFVRSLGSAFHWPAMQATTPLMVPKEHLSRIGGMNQMLFGVSSVLVPPVAALLLDVLPMQTMLMIDVLTALLAIGPLLVIAVPQPEAVANQPLSVRQVVADTREGVRFVWGWPGLLLIILMGTVIRLLLGPAVALMPLLIRNHFAGGAAELAWVRTAGGVGMIVGGLILAVWGGFKRPVVTAMLAQVIDGFAIFIMGTAPANGFSTVLIASLVAGIVEPIELGSLGAVAQATIPPRMQGRVFSLSDSLGQIMTPVGLSIAGPMADRYGPQIWLLVGGLATAMMGIAALFIPAIMQIERVVHPLEAEQPVA